MGNKLLTQLQAHYSRTVEEVYVDMATRVLLRDPEKSLTTLTTVQHPTLPVRAEERVQNGLSSLMPDWRHSEGHIMYEPVSPHYAHGNRTSQVQREGILLLYVRGITVQVCSMTLK